MPNFFSSCMLSLRKKNPFIFLSDLLIAQIQSIKTGLWTTLSLRLNHRCFMLLSHFLILNHIRKQNTHTFWYPPKYPPSILWLFRLVLCHLAHVSPSVTISRKSHPRPIKFTLIFTTIQQHSIKQVHVDKPVKKSKTDGAYKEIHFDLCKAQNLSLPSKICIYTHKSKTSPTNKPRLIPKPTKKHFLYISSTQTTWQKRKEELWRRVTRKA